MATHTFSISTAARIILATAVLAVMPTMAVASEGGIQPEAADKLRNALSYLARLQQFGMEIHSTIEVVTEDGQKIEFHFANDVTVQRPNKLYSRRLGAVADEEFFYDGKTLGLHYPSAGFYASLEAPDTLEGMLDFARESLDLVAPAGDFIYADAYEILMQDVHTAFEVPGPAFVEGVACDHLAFSLPGTDFQVWIQQGDQPLLRRLVITSRDIISAPQFTVSIREWNLNPDISDDLFQMTPPADAKNIEFIVVEQEGN